MADLYDLKVLKAVYDQDGVVKVPGLVSKAWVERLTHVLTDFLKNDPGEVTQSILVMGLGAPLYAGCGASGMKSSNSLPSLGSRQP